MSEQKNLNEEISFIDIFYESVDTLKNHWRSFLTVFFFKVFLTTFAFFFSATTDDAIKISVTLLDTIFSVVVFVVFVNIYYCKINDFKFSLRKCFWDLPTYIYYELAFGVLLLLGTILLVLPGLFVLYLFVFAPLVSILFDYDDSRNSFSIIRDYIKKNPILYFIVFVINGAMGIISMSAESAIAYLPHNIVLHIGASITLSFFIFICSGLVVSTFNEFSRVERERYMGQIEGK